MTTIVATKGMLACDSRRSRVDGNGNTAHTFDDSMKLVGVKNCYVNNSKKEKVRVVAFACTGAVPSISRFKVLFTKTTAKEEILLGEALDVFDAQLKHPELDVVMLLEDGYSVRVSWTEEPSTSSFRVKPTFFPPATVLVAGSGAKVIRLMAEMLPELLATDLVALARLFDKHTGGVVEYITSKKGKIGSYLKIPDEKINQIIELVKEKLQQPELPTGRDQV